MQWAFVIIVLILLLLRRVLPLLIKRFVNNKMAEFQQQFQHQQQAQAEAKSREGEVHIKRGPTKSQQVNNSSDIEDVDFEEIK